MSEHAGSGSYPMMGNRPFINPDMETRMINSRNSASYRAAFRQTLRLSQQKQGNEARQRKDWLRFLSIHTG
jgi:hypothetical protein